MIHSELMNKVLKIYGPNNKIFGDIHPFEIKDHNLFTEDGVFRYFFGISSHEKSSFGELGLLDGQPRSAYIICSRDSVFACIDKNDYIKLIAEKERKRF